MTGGSAAVPEGDLTVRLYDAAIGLTPLAQAQASASLDHAQRLKFNVELVPTEAKSTGHVRVGGVVPLKPADIPGMLFWPLVISPACADVVAQRQKARDMCALGVGIPLKPTDLPGV